MIRAKPASIIQGDRVRIYKSRHAAKERESTIRELLPPFRGKFGDQLVLVSEQSSRIDAHISRVNPPRRSIADCLAQLRRVQKGLGWHAAAQNAESSDGVGSFNDCRAGAPCRQRSRRGIAGAATADHD